MSKAHLTAMARKKPSRPVLRLEKAGLIVGRTLDYGCGRGADTDYLGCEGYDPHYRPDLPEGPFETIVCNYVLNVIDTEEGIVRALTNIRNLLAEDGVAYITVRANRKDLRGYTSRGTWQGLVVLDLPIQHRCADSITYEFRRDLDFAVEIQTFDKEGRNVAA